MTSLLTNPFAARMAEDMPPTTAELRDFRQVFDGRVYHGDWLPDHGQWAEGAVGQQVRHVDGRVMRYMPAEQTAQRSDGLIILAV